MYVMSAKKKKKMAELNAIEEDFLKRLAEDNEFFENLYDQWKLKGSLSEKQYACFERIYRKKKEAIEKSKKLSEFVDKQVQNKRI